MRDNPIQRLAAEDPERVANAIRRVLEQPQAAATLMALAGPVGAEVMTHLADREIEAVVAAALEVTFGDEAALQHALELSGLIAADVTEQSLPMELTDESGLASVLESLQKALGTLRASTLLSRLELRHSIDLPDTVNTAPKQIDGRRTDESVGPSAPMQSVRPQILDLQQNDSRILVLGEAGTGKEFVAREIHGGCSRSDRAFVPVHCARLPKQVQSLDQRTEALSILFGHKKGAFPGAETDREGLVQQAQGGTLYFDAVDVLPLPLQAHLLRVLTRKEVVPLGSDAGEPIDVRIMASTTKDLIRRIGAGTFQQELYDYLAQEMIRLTPLRERPEDIESFAQSFTRELQQQLQQVPQPLSTAAIDRLQEHGFPANLPELKKVVERALTERGGEAIRPDDLYLYANHRDGPEDRDNIAFADILNLTDADIQTMLREVDQKDLVISLKAASDELKDKILGNVSERVRIFLSEEMEYLGPMRLSEVEEVQRRIARQLHRLRQQGRIAVEESDDDPFV